MQQRRVAPWISLGTSNAQGGIGWVVSKRQHYGAAGPAILVDDLLDDRGDARGRLVSTLGTIGSSIRHTPLHLCRRCGPAGNVKGI